MLNSISHLKGAKVTATDGDIGTVKEVFFDDRNWAIRYLVVDTGSWLTDRLVLVSPYSVKELMGIDKHIHVSLTRQQVKASPDVDVHQPVSRQRERELLGYYQYPEYWDGGDLWAMGAVPYPPVIPIRADANRVAPLSDANAGEVHLRSSTHVTGYEVAATDESIGEVQDFVFDDESWAIRYLVVDTSSWWSLKRKVLIGMHWADRIDWATRKMHVNLTREQVKSSPEYEDVSSIHREYEVSLHHNYQRNGYWV